MLKNILESQEESYNGKMGTRVIALRVGGVTSFYLSDQLRMMSLITGRREFWAERSDIGKRLG